MLNKDNTVPAGSESDNSVTLFERVDGNRTDQVITEILDIHPDTWQYLTENEIKISFDPEDSPRKGAIVFFDAGDGDELTVNTFKHSCEEVMDEGVRLLKERQNAA